MVDATERAIQKVDVVARQEDEAKEIDLAELALVLLDNLRYIVLFFLLGALLFNAYSYFFIHPTYQSSASLYIVSASGGTVVDLTDLNLGSSLKNDYRELIMSYPVLDRVSKKLNLDWSTEQMARAVSVSNPADTRILKLTATAEDPELAMDIANTLATVAVEYLPETMSTDAPNIAAKGRLPKVKADPSYLRYTLMGGFLGALLCCAWFVFKTVTDETIHTPEDMERYFGAPPLTSIPYTSIFEQEDQQQHGSRRRKPKKSATRKKNAKRKRREI